MAASGRPGRARRTSGGSLSWGSSRQVRRVAGTSPTQPRIPKHETGADCHNPEKLSSGLGPSRGWGQAGVGTKPGLGPGRGRDQAGVGSGPSPGRAPLRRAVVHVRRTAICGSSRPVARSALYSMPTFWKRFQKPVPSSPLLVLLPFLETFPLRKTTGAAGVGRDRPHTKARRTWTSATSRRAPGTASEPSPA